MRPSCVLIGRRRQRSEKAPDQSDYMSPLSPKGTRMRDALSETARQRSAAALPSSCACVVRCGLPRPFRLAITVKVTKWCRVHPVAVLFFFFWFSLRPLLLPLPSVRVLARVCMRHTERRTALFVWSLASFLFPALPP